jgi:acyl-CoA thioesterase
MDTPFSALLERAEVGPEGLRVTVPDDWRQGRSIFGGLQLALCLRALRARVPEAPLRALQATFAAPVTEEVQVRTALLRQGKSATLAEARILDGDATAVLVTGFFGAPRDSAVRFVPAILAPPPALARRLPYVPGRTPSFTRHFEVTILQGSLPFQGVADTRAVYEVSLRDAGPVTEAHVVALADYVPPLALSHLTRPAPGSTVSWLLELLGAPLERLGLQRWRAHVSLDAARDGYSTQSVVLAGPDGVPVALSRQSMVVFG